MTTFRTVRPAPSEYNSFYAGYVNAVSDGDIIEALVSQKSSLLNWIDSASTKQADFRYAPGKWSAKEVVGHIIDTEWIFTYRALRFARGDQSPLPGMDQNQFMEGANFAERSLGDLRVEFSGLRTASTQLMGSFSEAVLDRVGIASDCPFTVRAMMWITAGHCQHHLTILNERYKMS
jgi:hypothetical protein